MFEKATRDLQLSADSAAVIYSRTLFFLAMAVAVGACFFGFSERLGTVRGGSVLLTVLLGIAPIAAWQEAHFWHYHRVSQAARSSIAFLCALFLPCLSLGNALLRIAIASIFAVLVLIAIRRAWSLAALDRSRLHMVILLGLLFGALYFVLKTSIGFANVFAPLRVLIGLGQLDTIFHAAIASMILFHGVPSTGLDGLVPIKYHVLSHFWIGTSSAWIGVPVIEAYSLLSTVVQVPLVLFAITIASTEEQSPNEPSGSFAWCIPLVFVGALELHSWGAHLGSESYMLGILIFLVSLPILLRIAKRDAGLVDWACAAVLVPLLIEAKISIGFIWAVGLAFLGFRVFPKLSPASYFGLGALGIVSSFFIVMKALSFISAYGLFSNALIGFYQFDPGMVLLSFGIIILGWVLAAFSYLVGSGYISRREVEVFFVLTLASLVPSLFLKPADAYQFLMVGDWLVFVAVSRVLIVSWPWGIQERYATSVVLLMLLAPWIIPGAKKGSFGLLVGTMRSLEQGAGLSIPPAGNDFGEKLKVAIRAWFDLSLVKGAVKNSPGYKITQLIVENVGIGASDTLVYVPPSNTMFWNIYDDCYGSPWLVPARTGVPMMNGVPSSNTGCAPYPYGGYTDYGANSRATLLGQMQLCDRARELGYFRIFMINSPSDYKMFACQRMPEGAQ
jgi:hypothetical protein